MVVLATGLGVPYLLSLPIAVLLMAGFGLLFAGATYWPLRHRGQLPVIISTIQTQNSANGDRKRMGRFNPKDFKVLIIDECHHATSDSYRSLINYYKTKKVGMVFNKW